MKQMMTMVYHVGSCRHWISGYENFDHNIEMLEAMKEAYEGILEATREKAISRFGAGANLFSDPDEPSRATWRRQDAEWRRVLTNPIRCIQHLHDYLPTVPTMYCQLYHLIFFNNASYL